MKIIYFYITEECIWAQGECLNLLNTYTYIGFRKGNLSFAVLDYTTASLTDGCNINAHNLNPEIFKGIYKNSEEN